MIAVVKANGMGHGAIIPSRHLKEIGVERLAVATVEEGKELRDAKIGGPIHLLGKPIWDSRFKDSRFKIFYCHHTYILGVCLQCHKILFSDSKDYTRAYWLYMGYPPVSAIQYNVQTIQNRL